MKLRIALLLLAVILVSAGYLTGQSSIFTKFNGNDRFVGMLDFGKLSCPGGQPDPTWSTGSPCTPGSRVHFRDSRFAYYLVSSNELITGPMELTSANGNYDGWIPGLGAGSGQMWGTMRR